MTVHRITAAAAFTALAFPAAAQVEYDLVIIEPWSTTYSLRTSSAARLNCS